MSNLFNLVRSYFYSPSSVCQHCGAQITTTMRHPDDTSQNSVIVCDMGCYINYLNHTNSHNLSDTTVGIVSTNTLTQEVISDDIQGDTHTLTQEVVPDDIQKDTQIDEEEDVERIFLWLESMDSINRLKDLGIVNPVLIDEDDRRGVEIIATVPNKLLPSLRQGKYKIIKSFEDPEDIRNYSHYSFN